MAKKLIKEYVFESGVGLLDNERPNAVSLLQQNKLYLLKEYVAYIQAEVTAANPDYTQIVYNYTNKENEISGILDALIHDLRYNGNEEVRKIALTYYANSILQIPGNGVAEVEALTYIRSIIINNILTNVEYTGSKQSEATQVINTNLTAESDAVSKAGTDLNNLINYIDNETLYERVNGLGKIEILGKIRLEDILIVTNVTRNTVIYNFAEPTKGGTAEFTLGNSVNYPQAASVDNGTTVIHFNFNTSVMNDADDIQIFLESTAQTVKMNDIASDAMERIKVGIPQAMLDADFEYGLQPTKWQAISTERGYPSTYEIPASEILVSQITTDASTGSNGVGASLITVDTINPHGFAVGDPFTIRALSSSVLGFNRAEGTFLVQSAPTTRQFTYYAKAKVGTNVGQVLATGNTQLREAKYYTGANVSNPTFSVITQGASGSFTTALNAPTGVTNLTFSGTAPPVGVVLSGTGIPTGTQITGVFGGNNSGGVEATKFVAENFTSGTNQIVLADVTGISPGMILASDNTVSAQQRVITSIAGNTLQLDGNINENYTGDNQTFTNNVLGSANYVVGTGTSATFDVTIDAGLNYSIQINNSGTGYAQGDTLRISGTALGGTSPTNDLDISVDFVNAGTIVQASVISTTTGASQTNFTNLSTTQIANPYATNGSVNIAKSAGSYTVGAIQIAGTGFRLGHKFIVSGNNLGGNSPNNDATVTVTSTDGSGGITAFTVSGTSARGDSIDIYGGITVSQASTQTISTGATLTSNGVAEIEVTFSENHGLIPGNAITIQITSGGTNHEIAGGPYFVQEVPSLTTIRYIARTSGTIDVSTDDLKGTIYIRSDAFFAHRPFDGGVQLGTGSPQHGNQAIRMSKKYIRYQSGKGAMYNTGALFAPSFDIASITADGTTVGSLITVTTDDADHGLQNGAEVQISGVETIGYNGHYIVTNVIDERTFKITAQRVLGNATATIGSQCQVALYKWHGAVVRSGCFDDQNGIFWQYNGQEMQLGRRTSTFQCAGTVTVNPNSSVINGTNTRFLDQLQEGDRIVLKGMTHVVSQIVNNTQLYITPGFRGVTTVTGSKIAKVQDDIIPQSEWNIDRCDGTGPSGYDLDVTKMQMIGIQFTWYGAGFIDWMLRGPDGDYIFCHRLKGNNLNTEAYMRTGNLPVRYEVTNEGARSKLANAISNTVTSLTLKDAYDFPNAGTVYIGNEIISYTGKSGNTLTGLTRGATLSNFAGGSTRSYTAGSAVGHNANAGVVLISCTTTPIISHWGSAYLIDGQFDEDRGYIFSYPETNIDVSTTKKTAFMLRLAPSVSNAITGDLGERELLNRAQLLLSSLEITSDGVDPNNNNEPITGGIIVEGIINPVNYPVNPSDANWSGLTSLAQGGQPSFAQVAAGGGINWNSGTTQTEATVAIQGNMTLSGVTNVFEVDARGSSRDNFMYVPLSSVDDDGLRVGMTCNTTPFNGRVITGITRFPGFGDAYVQFDGTASNEGQNYSSSSLSLSFTFATEKTNSNVVYFQKTSFDNSNATIGTSVSTSDTNWPAGTIISTINEQNIGSTDFYEVLFNNSSNATLNSTNTVTFLFGQPPYAQPGETVFSLIAQPGELSSIDLSSLKELTTTTIGGRGAFPNGPDVLAINIYKVSGDATTANILLRWGEAQA